MHSSFCKALEREFSYWKVRSCRHRMRDESKDLIPRTRGGCARTVKPILVQVGMQSVGMLAVTLEARSQT
jgi:hypothetical protein